MALYILQKNRIVFLLLFVICACSDNSKNQDLVKRKNLQIRELQTQLDYIIQNDNYKSNLISSFESDLDSIDSTFIYFKGANNEMIMDQKSDKIFLQIKNLKNRIEIAENNLLNELNRAKNFDLKRQKEIKNLLKIIKRYKLIISTKEIEIDKLKSKIISQQNTISDKEIIIAKKDDDIKNLEKNSIKLKAETYDKLSKELNDIADNLPLIKGWFRKKSKENIKRLRNDLRNEANVYKNKAYNLWLKYYE
jgi:hypothetical protein